MHHQPPLPQDLSHPLPRSTHHGHNSPSRPQLTSQEEQKLPQALLVELQGVTVVFAFLLLKETPGTGVQPGRGGDTPAPSP